MVNARKKGNNYELKIRKKYIEIGYEDCVTSRYASKFTDDKGVDLINTTPFLPQCKNYKVYPVSKVIDNIDTIKKNFKEGIPIVHVHLTSKRKGIVAMEEDVFFNLIKLLKDKGILSQLINK